MTGHVGAAVIETTDLTPIPGLAASDETWLRRLVQVADASSLVPSLSGRDTNDVEQIAFYDERSGCWWTGRYVGEVQYEGRTLRIVPRFGMPNLLRWLSCIWGIRLLSTKGTYEKTQIWLWALLAKVWESQLLAAAKHGLPTSRVYQLHRGQTIRGRLEVRLTAQELNTGKQNAISQTRNRYVDHRIGGIIFYAFEQLRRELRHLGDERSWLTLRGQTIVTDLRTHVNRRDSINAAVSRAPVRYTPITEIYREVVQLSQAIARHQPSSSVSQGSKDVLGVLIDMAEVWELYVYHLLRSSIREVEVLHTGRDASANNFLLRSEQTGDRLGNLRPDILFLAPRDNRILCDHRREIQNDQTHTREASWHSAGDLYQMAAYLSALGRPSELLTGGLVYPATLTTTNITILQDKSPWQLLASERRLWFFGLCCEESSGVGIELAESESAFIKRVRSALGTSFVFGLAS